MAICSCLMPINIEHTFQYRLFILFLTLPSPPPTLVRGGGGGGKGVGYLDLFFCLWSSRGEIYLTKGRLYKKQKQKKPKEMVHFLYRYLLRVMKLKLHTV